MALHLLGAPWKYLTKSSWISFPFGNRICPKEAISRFHMILYKGMNTSTTTHTQIPRHKHHATGYKVHIWSHQLYRLWKGSEPFLSAGDKVSLKSPISIHGEHIKSPFKISGAWTEIKIHIKLDWINKNPGLLKLYWSIQSLTRTTMIACTHEFPKPSTNFHQNPSLW
jgi:hypothetical protein